MNDKLKDFYGITVAKTSSGKTVSIPYNSKVFGKYLDFICSNFNWFEIFEIHAIFEFLSIREIRKIDADFGAFNMFQAISKETRRFLEEKMKFDTAIKRANIKSSVDILKLGESLVLSEFKGI